jgi:hypothetical protein
MLMQGGPGGAAGGRGAGPDHREVRYAEGVLAMINILRVLALGGPRVMDGATLKQVRVCMRGCWPLPNRSTYCARVRHGLSGLHYRVVPLASSCCC